MAQDILAGSNWFSDGKWVVHLAREKLI